MLFTQFNLEDARKVWYQEAFEDGEESGQARGVEQGQAIKLIAQTCCKLRKGKTPEVIAEELEESLENVEKICAAVDKCGLDADVMEIREQLYKEYDI